MSITTKYIVTLWLPAGGRIVFDTYEEDYMALKNSISSPTVESIHFETTDGEWVRIAVGPNSGVIYSIQKQTIGVPE